MPVPLARERARPRCQTRPLTLGLTPGLGVRVNPKPAVAPRRTSALGNVKIDQSVTPPFPPFRRGGHEARRVAPAVLGLTPLLLTAL